MKNDSYPFLIILFKSSIHDAKYILSLVSLANLEMLDDRESIIVFI